MLYNYKTNNNENIKRLRISFTIMVSIFYRFINLITFNMKKLTKQEIKEIKFIAKTALYAYFILVILIITGIIILNYFNL